MDNNNKYFSALDGLRGYSVILVIMFHAGVFNFGWIGVQVFFVLSGFLITRILYGYKSRYGFKQYLRNFYARRILRIFPLYYLYVFIVLIIFLIYKYPVNFNKELPYILTYLYNFSFFTELSSSKGLVYHLWSLCVEEQFYLIWPFLVFILNKKQLLYVSGVLILGVPVIRYLLGGYLKNIVDVDYIIGDTIYWFTFSHFDAFALGGIAGVFYKDIKVSVSKIFASIFIITLLTGIVNSIQQSFSILDYLSTLGFPFVSIVNYQYLWSYSILNFFAASLIVLLISSKVKFIKPIFENGVIVKIGQVSYGMYIYHVLVIKVVGGVFENIIHGFLYRFLFFIVYLAITYVIARISYSFFELHFLRLKKYF